jgi:hypothetical protein
LGHLKDLEISTVNINDSFHWKTLKYLNINENRKHVDRQKFVNCWSLLSYLAFGPLKSDSTHHFFRNACTKSGSLRFSQFSGCWQILSVYIIMSFDWNKIGKIVVKAVPYSVT